MAFFHIRAYTHPKTVSIRARKPLFFPLRAPLKGRRGCFPMGSVREAGQGLFCAKINTFQNQRKEAPDMAVFRIEKTRDYTVMSNYHLRDRSLKATCPSCCRCRRTGTTPWRGLPASARTASTASAAGSGSWRRTAISSGRASATRTGSLALSSTPSWRSRRSRHRRPRLSGKNLYGKIQYR